MSGQWYYQLLMEEFGPVSAEQLIELSECGTLGDDDQVRITSGDWMPLGEAMADLQAAAGSEDDSVEEISDLSELAFEFEDSGPTTVREISGRTLRQSPKPEAAKPTPQKAASFFTETTPLPVPTPPALTIANNPNPAAPAATAIAADAWYYMSFEHLMGPMSFDALQALAQTGVITAEDPVRCGTEGGWRRAKNLPRLAIAIAISQKSGAAPSQTIGTSAAGGSAVEVPAEAESDVSEKPTKEKPQRRKGEKKKGRAQDELPDDVFGEVFSSPSKPPARPIGSEASTPTTMATGGGSRPIIDTVQSSGTSESIPLPAAPAYSPPAESVSQWSSPAPTSAPRPTFTPPPKKSSGKGFSVDPKMLGIVGAVVGVLLLGAAIWQFGLPFGGGGNGPFKPKFVVDTLKDVMKRIDSAAASKKPAAWAEVVGEAKASVGIILNHAQTSGGKTPSAKAAVAAVGALQKILATTADNKAVIAQGKAEFNKQIALVK